MHMLSADGISHSFDSKANGYGRGEGFGAILLKPLSKAMADGDAIRAIVRATGSNQDGRTPGITMPNATAQADLIRSTYSQARLAMGDTSYFEAHGTGTAIGVSMKFNVAKQCTKSVIRILLNYLPSEQALVPNESQAMSLFTSDLSKAT